MNESYAFRDLSGLTKFLKLLLGIGIAVSVTSLLSSAMQLELLNRPSFTEAEATTNDLREMIIGWGDLALAVLTAIVFGRWIVQANKNVRALGAAGLRVTPGWAVGYLFVPIVSLWKPYQAMSDLWRASRDPAAWTSVPRGSILPIWWGLWVASNVIGQVAFRATMAAEGLEALRDATIIQMVTEAIHIPLCLAARVLVTQIGEAQRAQAPTIAAAPVVSVGEPVPTAN